MNACVLDASVAVSWCFEETQTPYAIEVLRLISEGTEVHVPHIWPLEVANALVKLTRSMLTARPLLQIGTSWLALSEVERRRLS